MMIPAYRGFWGRGVQIWQNQISKIDIFDRGGTRRGVKHSFPFNSSNLKNLIKVGVLAVFDIRECKCRVKMQKDCGRGGTRSTGGAIGKSLYKLNIILYSHVPACENG